MFLPTNNKKELNFELNLMPVIDVLSVCVCFLLMTVVWIHLSALDVHQAIGGQSKDQTKNPPSVWAYMNAGGQVTFSVKDSPVAARDLVIPGQGGNVNWNEVIARINVFEKQIPGLNTALIMPTSKSQYADIIHLMDQFKKTGVKDVGIAPL